MPGLLGKKIGMTSVFSADGKNVPCTVVEVGPCVVTQIKTIEKDGYEAIQLGYMDKKEKHTTQAELGCKSMFTYTSVIVGANNCKKKQKWFSVWK